MESRRIGRSSGGTAFGVAPLLAGLAVALMICPARAEEPAPTNLDLMTRLGNQVVAEIIGEIEPEVRGVRLRIVPSANTEEYVVLEDVFTRLLEERGIDTVYREPEEGDSLYELDYRVPVFRLSYPKVYRSHLIGGKKVKREANLRVHAKLIADDGDVLWIGDSSAEFSDQFPHGDLSRIQEGSYEFVNPEMPGSGWGKLVEPVLVSAIIVGMVYLFFSNQSDS